RRECVLLTGGTGFLGAFLLLELLEQTQARISCLVRAADATAGMTRLRQNLAPYGLSHADFDARVVPVLGDLEQPGLGMPSADLARLADEIDAIYHNGARVNFVQ